MQRTHATQAVALPAMRALRKRKPQATQDRLRWQPWLAASIEHSYWLALAFVAWETESVLSLRFLTQWPLASVAWLALACFCFFFACVIFLRLLRFLRTFYFACVFFLRKTLRALRAFERKPGFMYEYSGSQCYFWPLGYCVTSLQQLDLHVCLSVISLSADLPRRH